MRSTSSAAPPRRCKPSPGTSACLIEPIDRFATPCAGRVLKGEFSGLRRLRVGNYRIVYEVQAQQLVVLVVRIGRRRDIYR